ncbi:FKBP-type peptidyl-prolyl cis-trans isomerase [Myroides sp. 1354]|uniref:FKBP-type peptidyl-prolyl cis-trans isomerase n=1 Tax=unclassified Myroides TaxID=2642485 RepID=UPI002578069E|nr:MULTISPECIES: FKBP-type peptidyl-prolyl cis-trans isomerase [unclassified Myroides]MDM1044788.1 FKBP-type peptidyl-prolyl cis-trans isomerase [Myroides sp. R163-1]MDM1055501.1 FKBP-type peptidyl-prolyl cis-trans isomerase [Myroides sp. 1354]MDM1068798.1 FKBP-type peptidyl-prolyl cis-trans isomerase [Myroides sp. 1372]
MSVAELLKKKRELLEQTNKEEGAIFLAQFSQRANVVVLPSGISYEILTLGEGERATVEDAIVCHYTGTNVKGEVFDSSIQRGTPSTFKIKKLIKAYQEVVPLLPMGTKFIMVTPPEYAYKEEHISKEIGPYSTLQFEVELMAIAP